MTNSKRNAFFKNARQNVRLLALFIGVFWMVAAADWLVGGQLAMLGIRPRTVLGLCAIAWAPFLHVNFTHLMGNTVPFAILGTMILVHGRATLIRVFVISALLSGLGCWTLGASNSIHIGASGVVFGFLGFLLLYAFYDKSVLAIVTAILAAVVYGGILWSLLGFREGISWQGHLFGFIGGIVAAKRLKKRRSPTHRSFT